MINKNVGKYVECNWSQYIDTVKAISSSSSEDPLVDSTEKLYNFDEICSTLFNQSCKPSSADGVLLQNNILYLIEFKSGFKDKISKYNFNKEKAICTKTNEFCEEYWQIFFQKRELEKSELISSIKAKVVESYITFEKKIFPKCEDLCSSHKYIIIFIVVIDEDEINSMENILSDLSSAYPSDNNCYKQVRQALKKYLKATDTNGQEYFYDDIKVMSSVDFKNFIEQH